MRDVFGNVTKVCYNTFDGPEKVIDGNGIVTENRYGALVLKTEKWSLNEIHRE